MFVCLKYLDRQHGKNNTRQFLRSQKKRRKKNIVCRHRIAIAARECYILTIDFVGFRAKNARRLEKLIVQPKLIVYFQFWSYAFFPLQIRSQNLPFRFLSTPKSIWFGVDFYFSK